MTLRAYLLCICWLFGSIATAIGQPDQLAALYEKQLKEKKKKEAGQTAYKLGELLLSEDHLNVREAIRWLNLAITTAGSVQDKETAAKASLRLARHYHRYDYFSEAEYAYQQAERDFKSAKKEAGYAEAIGGKAIMLVEQKKYSTAIPLLEEALELAAKYKLGRLELDGRVALSKAYERTGNKKKARAVEQLDEPAVAAAEHSPATPTETSTTVPAAETQPEPVTSVFNDTRTIEKELKQLQAELKDTTARKAEDMEDLQKKVSLLQSQYVRLQKESKKQAKELEETKEDLGEAESKLSHQELLLEKRNAERNMFIIGGVATAVLFVVLGLAYRGQQQANRKLSAQNVEISRQKSEIESQSEEIRQQREKSERLLLNILPRAVADELKEKGYATPQYYEMVTVLFTDFKGFTTLAERMTPAQLIKELDACFMAFDEIAERNSLEKIKTIGDAYMCAGGIPLPNHTNPHDAVRAGLEMQEYMENRNRDRKMRGEPYLELRVGIHTGQVVAGVVGKNKFAYDVWGDAVNTASRMESSGEPGRVNISGATYECVKDDFLCVYRGRIPAKNKGDIDMYFVNSRL